MRIMGIDQSLSGTGICILEDSVLIYHTLIKSTPKDGDVYQRVNNIATTIEEIIKDYQIELVQIEGIALGAKGHIADLGGLQHVIINKVKYTHQINVNVIPPKTLKKQATGNGNAGKWLMYDALPSNIQLVISENYKLPSRTAKTVSGSGFDLTDAFHLANYS